MAAGWWHGWPGRALRLALGILPLIWLTRLVRWQDVAAGALRVGPGGLLLAWGAMFAAVVFSALRWRALLVAYGADPARLPGFPALLRIYLVSLYFAVLPTGMVGEVVRGRRVEHCFERPATAYLLLVVERLAGLLGLLVLAAVVTAWAPLPGRSALTATVGVAVALGLVASLVLFAVPQVSGAVPAVARAVRRVPLVGPALAALPAARDARGPVVAVALSVLTQGFTSLSAAPLLLPIDPHATVEGCLQVGPAILFVTFIPVTPSALGQRELAFVHFFALVGVGAASAMAASLLTLALSLSLALLGGALFLSERSGSR